MAGCELASGADTRLDEHITRAGARATTFAGDDLRFEARRVVEDVALALQGSLLVRHAPESVADAFCATRLAGEGGRVYGTLPPDVDAGAIIERASPVWVHAGTASASPAPGGGGDERRAGARHPFARRGPSGTRALPRLPPV